MPPTVTPPSSPFTVALVGAGRVGTAVAELLRRSGHMIVGISSRTTESAELATTVIGSTAFPLDDLPASDVTLIGVPDDAIEEVATALAGRVTHGNVVCHFAGSLGLGPLAPVIEAGAFACALHPVQACPDVATAIERLPGSAWGVTCTWPITDWSTDVVRGDLAGIPVMVRDEDRPLWHAAAVTTSNGTAGLLALGEMLLQSIGIDDPTAVLGPLVMGTVANALEGGGGAENLTGPAVRGEHATLQRHLHAIAGHVPELTEAYTLAARSIVETARRAGRIDDDARDAMLRALETWR